MPDLALLMTRDPLTQLADDVRQLTEHYRHEERRFVWSRSRNRIEVTPHITWHAPLLEQMHMIAYNLPGGQITARVRATGTPATRVRLDALLRLDEIRQELKAWQLVIRVRSRGSLTEDLRGLVGEAAELSPHIRADLADDVRRWRRRCELLCGWT